MRINKVEVINLRYDYPAGLDMACAEGVMGSRLSSVVVVSTDAGLTGAGSAYSHPDLVRVIVERHLGPHLVGEDPSDVEALWDKMYSLTRWYGRKGAAISALGAVDVALWDIRGKNRGEPIYRLLGGTSPVVTAYASGLLWQDDLDAMAQEAADHVRAGFTLMKMRLGRTPEYDRAAVEAVLAAIEDKARVAVDGTHRYSLAEAIDLSSFLVERGVAWFEEPFHPKIWMRTPPCARGSTYRLRPGRTSLVCRDSAS